MVKLIRLTTQNRTALFDNNFNDDLVLPPQSKIALKSLSMETENDVLVVDALNSNVNFQVSNGFARNFNLNHRTYNKDNYEELFQDIQEKLNSNTGFDFTNFQVRRNYGLEWKCAVNDNKKVSVEYKIGENGEYVDLLDYDDTKVERVTTGGGTWRQKAGQPNNADNDRSMKLDTYISLGCSFIRARTATYDNNLAIQPQSNGYIIGLSTTNISELQPDEITNDMLTHGIAVTCGVGNVRRYDTVSNGIYTLSAVVPNFIGNQDTENDFQEVVKTFNKIELNVYQQGTVGPTLLLEADANPDEKLYPFIIFRGGNVSLNALRTIPSPYSTAPQLSQPLLGAPPQPQRNPGENFIEFLLSVASFLGFSNARKPQVGTINAVELAYVADRQFRPVEISDAFIVESLNLKLESFDGLKNQRKNILAVIPKSNLTGEIIYDTNYPTFIDLNNKNEILLRNLRLRVVYPDYSQVAQLGTSSMVLLIDN